MSFPTRIKEPVNLGCAQGLYLTHHLSLPSGNLSLHACFHKRKLYGDINVQFCKKKNASFLILGCAFICLNTGADISPISIHSKLLAGMHTKKESSLLLANNTVLTSDPVNFNGPASIVLSKDNHIAYVVNSNTNNISRCTVDDLGNFLSCEPAGGNNNINLQVPGSMSFNSSYSMAYITNRTHDAVSQCNVDKNGYLLSCKYVFDKTFDLPFDVAINGANTAAYVSNPSSDRQSIISHCPIDTKGNLQTCEDAGGGKLFASPAGLAISPDGKIIFITDLEKNAVFRCDLKTDGNFSGCKDTGGKGFTNPIRVKLNSTGTIAIVANFGDSSVTRCNIDSSGMFSNCKNSGADNGNMQSLYGLELNSSKTLAFLSDIDHNTVYRCRVDQSGNLSLCRLARQFITVDLNNKAVSVLNLHSDSTGDITLNNISGQKINALKVIIPDDKKSLFVDGSSCPINTAKELQPNASCKIHYNIPSLLSSGEFEIKILNDKDILEDIPASTSSLELKQNGASATSIHVYPSEKNGSISLKSNQNIDKLSLSFGGENKALSTAFKGSCLTNKELKADTPCTLTYNIPSSSPVENAYYDVESNGLPIYRIIIFVQKGSMLNMQNMSMHLYNTQTFTLTNMLDRPITHMEAISTNPKILSNISGNCGTSEAPVTLAPGQKCTLSAFLTDNRNPKDSVALKVQADQFLPLEQPIPTGTFKTKIIAVRNSGGYTLLAKYPSLQANGSITQLNTGYFPIDQQKNINTVIFDTPQSVPGFITSHPQIELHARSGKSRTLASLGRDIKCDKSILNVHCFYTD